jgi:tRNA pseudouridine38-40 synthase
MTDGAGRTLRLRLRYDGTDFHGWQIQPDARTVQGELKRALETILGHEVRTAAAGRTDAGVHALGQVASFPTSNPIPAGALVRALNSLLPPDVRVDRAAEAPPGFHARHSARSRTYRYHVRRRPGPIRRRYAWIVPRAPGVAPLIAATEPLLGRHDFAAFTSGEGLEGDTTCRILRAEWQESGDRLVLILTADRFLYRMVRTIVGTTMALAREGRLVPAEMAAFLAPGAPRHPSAPAPPNGLFLARVDYDAAPPPRTF